MKRVTSLLQAISITHAVAASAAPVPYQWDDRSHIRHVVPASIRSIPSSFGFVAQALWAAPESQAGELLTPAYRNILSWYVAMYSQDVPLALTLL